MAEIKDGGPAFPRPAGTHDRGTPGMSLRDWLAGQALAGIMTSAKDLDPAVRHDAVIAKAAYQMADAMLKARGQ